MLFSKKKRAKAHLISRTSIIASLNLLQHSVNHSPTKRTPCDWMYWC